MRARLRPVESAAGHQSVRTGRVLDLWLCCFDRLSQEEFQLVELDEASWRHWLSYARLLVGQNRFNDAASILASLDEATTVARARPELRKRIAQERLFCAIRRLSHSSGEVTWRHLCNIDVARLADPGKLDRAKSHAARSMALSIERGQSLEGTDWAAAILWRRRATNLTPDLISNWYPLLMALLYSDRPGEMAVALADAPAELTDRLRELIGAAPRVLPALGRSSDLVFGRTAPDYVECGLPVVPCFGKKPIFEDWRRYSDEMPGPERLQRWMAIPWAQIGLVLGAQSNIGILDIDAADPRPAATVAEALPPSLWRRVGRHGMALAFRRSAVPPAFGLAPDRTHVFDYMNDGRLLMLPPSIHPNTGAPYIANCHLTEVIDDLAEIPPDYADRIIHRAAKAGYSVESPIAGASPVA